MKLTVHELRKKLQLFEIQTVRIFISLPLTVSVLSGRQAVFGCLVGHGVLFLFAFLYIGILVMWFVRRIWFVRWHEECSFRVRLSCSIVLSSLKIRFRWATVGRRNSKHKLKNFSPGSNSLNAKKLLIQCQKSTKLHFYLITIIFYRINHHF